MSGRMELEPGCDVMSWPAFRREAGSAVDAGQDEYDLRGRTVLVDEWPIDFASPPFSQASLCICNGVFLDRGRWEAEMASSFTGIYTSRNLAWFRVRGWGLWLKRGPGHDLHDVRERSHYLGRLRWRVLRPGS
jgi:hypothetical protein